MAKKIDTKEGKLSEIQKSNAELVPVVAKLEITTAEQNKGAIDMSNQIKARIKRIEELRKFFVEDLTKKVNQINGEFRAVRKPLEDMLTVIDNKLIDWRRKEQARIDEEMRIEREKKQKEFEKEQKRLAKIAEKEAEKERKRLAKEKLTKKEEKAELKRIEDEKKAKIDEAQSGELDFDDSDFQQNKTVHSETGATTFKKVTDFEVTDPTKIPRQYMQVNLVEIRKAVKAGVKNIPGVNIFEKEVVNRKI